MHRKGSKEATYGNVDNRVALVRPAFAQLRAKYNTISPDSGIGSRAECDCECPCQVTYKTQSIRAILPPVQPAQSITLHRTESAVEHVAHRKHCMGAGSTAASTGGTKRCTDLSHGAVSRLGLHGALRARSVRTVQSSSISPANSTISTGARRCVMADQAQCGHNELVNTSPCIS